MFYVIQENLFKEYHYDLLLKTMDRFNFRYDIVKYLPFDGNIYEWYDREVVGDDYEPVLYKTNESKIFCFGATSMANAAKRYGWSPGSMINENHDFEVYSKKYGKENMLNGDGIVINFSDPLPFDSDEYFIRPTMDTKIFSGSIFTKEAWNNYNKTCNDSDTVNLITEETKILVSHPKHIQQEVRCWVVGGKVITISRYKIGNRVIYANYDHELDFFNFAQQMVDKFQVAEAFVIDICLADDEFKIVEINNINSAGFYHCDIVKLIEALEDHFN